MSNNSCHTYINIANGITDFDQELFYTSNPMAGAPVNYNGNISAVRWRMGSSTATQQGYGFTYDGLGRLTTSIYGEGASLSSNPSLYNESQTYDKMGNVVTTTGGTIIIYEGSIKAEINNIIPSFGEVNTLIKSLPNNIAVDAVIGSVGVHEAIHTLPDNIKKNAENSRAKMEKKPEPHDLELNPTLTQIQYLKELITNIKTNKNEQ